MTFQVTKIFGLDFMSSCCGHFEFRRVIFIMTHLSEWVFWQSFWTIILDFRLQISNFRSTHWASALLNRYNICLSNGIAFRVPVHTLTCLSVDLRLCNYPRRWPNIKKKWIQRSVFQCFNCPYIPNTQCRFNTGPLSATLARNWNIA